MTQSLTTLCHYDECRFLLIVMLNVIMLSVIMLNVIMLNVIMLNVIMLNVIMLNVIMLSVIVLNVVILSVLGPFRFSLIFAGKTLTMVALKGTIQVGPNLALKYMARVRLAGHSYAEFHYAECHYAECCWALPA
jgi:hypothetical protein